jgi:hypothetical protein
MGTKRMLCLAMWGVMLAFTALPALALTDQQKQQLEQLDLMDHQEFVVQTEKAYDCIHARDYACAEKKIAKAAKFVNNPHDKTTLRMAKQDLAAERKFEAAEQAAAADRVRQIKLAEARAAQEEANRRQRERERQEAEERDNNIRGGLAILSGAAAGYATRNYAPDQQTRIMNSTMDAVYNGNLEGLNSTLSQVGSEREQAHNEKMQQIREQKARDERAAQAKRERDEREARAARAQREHDQQAAKSQQEREARRAQEAERQRQARLKQQPAQQPAQGPKYVPQHVVIPSFAQTCPPGSSPARHANGVNIAAAGGAYCVKDPVKTAALVVNQGSGSGSGSGPGSGPGSGATGGAASPAPGSSNAGGTKKGKDQSTGGKKSGGGAASKGGAEVDVPVKGPPPKTYFRKIPADPPRGSGPGPKVKGVENYTSEGVSYSCQGVNSYGHQYSKAAGALVKAYFDSDYRSEERCQTWCDVLSWREEMLSAFHYSGQWDCSPNGMWEGLNQISGYKNGNNDQRCTCVTGNDTPIIFSPTPKR